MHVEVNVKARRALSNGEDQSAHIHTQSNQAAGLSAMLISDAGPISMLSLLQAHHGCLPLGRIPVLPLVVGEDPQHPDRVEVQVLHDLPERMGAEAVLAIDEGQGAKLGHPCPLRIERVKEELRRDQQKLVLLDHFPPLLTPPRVHSGGADDVLCVQALCPPRLVEVMPDERHRGREDACLLRARRRGVDALSAERDARPRRLGRPRRPRGGEVEDRVVFDALVHDVPWQHLTHVHVAWVAQHDRGWGKQRR